MNAHRKITEPDLSVIYAMPYRTAIDHIATTRALVVRIALNASMVSAGCTDQERTKLCQQLQEQARSLRKVMSVLRGDDVFSDLPDELSHWLSHASRAHDSEVRIFARMVDMTEALTNASESDEGITSTALHAYIKMGETEFFEAVTNLVSSVWEHIESGRNQQLDMAMQSAGRLSEGLNRLERIGKYVRSMSINASVEASRAGEAGKGLAIIAQEFKVLAEEVQQLTVSAREDIESIEASH